MIISRREDSLGAREFVEENLPIIKVKIDAEEELYIEEL